MTMYKISNTDYHSQRQAKELSVAYFVEASDGVYYVEKDRFGKYILDGRFVNALQVAGALNNHKFNKVAVERRDGTVVLNHNFIS
jgi:hypothetical protein